MTEFTNDQILDVARYKCKKSFLFFTRYFFKKRFNRKFVVNSHHEVIVDALEKVTNGEIKKLIINIAPRYSKTELAVKNFIAHSLAVNPSARFIHLSYSDDLALDNSEDIKDIVISDEYQELFPEVKIKKDAKAKKKWYTTSSGGVYATATGGQVTGFGAGKVDDEEETDEDFDLFGGAIIIDDPIKPEDADSTTKRDRINNRFDSTIKNRVNSRNTPIIIIMQRLHPEDLCGFLIDKDTKNEWTVISLPCITEEKEALWSFKHTLEELIDLRKDNPTVFDRQYQQNPQPLEGLIFGKQDLQYYDDLPPVSEWEVKICYSDPADEGIDNHSAPFAIISKGLIYVHDVIFTQDNLSDVEPVFLAKLKEHEIDEMFVESNNAGAFFIRDLRDKTPVPITGLKNTTNKIARILAQQGFVKERFRFRRNFNPQGEYGLFMKQTWNILKNGQEKKDDAPDSIAGLAFMIRRNYSEILI